MLKWIVTLGEIMTRLATLDYERIVQARRLDISYGGAEANVAIALAQWNNRASFVTRLPENALGDAVLFYLRGWGVETDLILRGGKRQGTYYVETGASVRPSRIIYDREGSAFAEITPDSVDWDEVFSGKDWFHFTGITPALSESCHETCLAAVKSAKRNGLTVSFDPNYRSLLWSREKAARVMQQYLEYIDVLITNPGGARDLFNIRLWDSNLSKETLQEAATETSLELAKLGNFRCVALTLRKPISASRTEWSAWLFDGKHHYRGKNYVFEIVDGLGGGDAFSAGLIHGLLRDWEPQRTIEFATAAAALKHTIPGDFDLVSEDEIVRLVEGDNPGFIQR